MRAVRGKKNQYYRPSGWYIKGIKHSNAIHQPDIKSRHNEATPPVFRKRRRRCGVIFLGGSEGRAETGERRAESGERRPERGTGERKGSGGVHCLGRLLRKSLISDLLPRSRIMKQWSPRCRMAAVHSSWASKRQSPLCGSSTPKSEA